MLLGGVKALHFIERDINKLVKKNKTRDPFELCDLENIHCIVMDLHAEINGLYQYIQRNKFIYINSNLPEEEKKAICGHELGHAILHKKLNCTFLKNYTYTNLSKYEREANIFSALLLIPEVDKDMFYEQTIDEISCKLRVPRELLELRLQMN